MADITFKHVVKTYDNKNTVVPDLNLEIHDKEFIVLVGPSGCGKSTTLRMIAGLEEISSGDLYIGDRRVNDVAPKDRDIAMVFQSYALYPHMTVYKNMSFALELHGTPKDEIDKKVREAAEILGLTEYLDRKPKALSGGQRQRVALGRAMVRNPAVFLLDEPLSNLDAKLRTEMRSQIAALHKRLQTTFVYVTHDQMEAMTLATKICLINNGVLQQYEAPLTVYSRPNNLFVADFVGNPSINFIEAKGVQNENGSLDVTILDGRKAKFVPKEHLDLLRWFAERDKNEADEAARHKEKMQDKKAVEKSNKDEVFKYHIARVNEDDYALQEAPVITNEDFVIGVRPEALQLHDGAGLDGVIYGAMPTGMESTIKLRIGDFLLTGVVFGNTTYKIGQEVKFEIGGEDILLFDRKSGKLITAGRLQV